MQSSEKIDKELLEKIFFSLCVYTSLQDMSTMEGELEILLGELHIKMKGANTHTHTCTHAAFRALGNLQIISDTLSPRHLTSAFTCRSHRLRSTLSRRPVRGWIFYLKTKNFQHLHANNLMCRTSERNTIYCLVLSIKLLIFTF